jgi:carbon monoxide dehydrogenase subunit G
MASTKVHIDLSAAPDDVWQLIGGFGSLPDWMPGVTQSELADGGRIRHLHDTHGHAFVEQLETYDHAARSYSYSILQSPVSVTGYLATITVTPASDGCAHVEWSATFNPGGITKDEAESIFSGIFTSGLTALATRFPANSAA